MSWNGWNGCDANVMSMLAHGGLAGWVCVVRNLAFIEFIDGFDYLID